MFLGCSVYAQPFEFLLHKDTMFKAPVDGVYVDLDTYVAISYELDKIDTLKHQIPIVREAFDSLKVASDSLVKAHLEHKETNASILKLERQSKNEVLEKYYNVRHNNKILRDNNKKLKSQRNFLLGTVGTIVVTTVTVVVVKGIVTTNKDP